MQGGTAYYDLMEAIRTGSRWLGATARMIGTIPPGPIPPNPVLRLLGAWGEVTERTFARMGARPDWGITQAHGDAGDEHAVREEIVLHRPFGDLIRFHAPGRGKRRILLVAPMSGHHATLVRPTVLSLLPECEVFVTDWQNARDVPLAAGNFDIEDYTRYLIDFIRHLGPDIHVMAICQPAPLALSAVAWLAQIEPQAQPRSLVLLGGPVDPTAATTSVTDFGHRVGMGQLEQALIQTVGSGFKGAGRRVFPGYLQLSTFISMNPDRHAAAFHRQIWRVAAGAAADHDRHNRFYDEYVAVMDMTAEFYLSTVERVFKRVEIGRNAFSLQGEPVDIAAIRDTAVLVVEGERDDISAPGQCRAALELMPHLPDARKAAHLEPGAGHFGLFAGASWRNNIRRLVLAFMDRHSAASGRGHAPCPRISAPSAASAGLAAEGQGTRVDPAAAGSP